MDAFYWKRGKLRGTVQLSFRLLEYLLPTFPYEGGEPTEFWPEAENQPPGSNFDPSRPLDFLEDPSHYKLNLNGWTLGLMLTRDF